MTTADDRHNEDVWAQAVADDAKQQRERVLGEEPAPEPEQQAPGKQSTADLFGPELGPLVEEVRKFASAVGGRVDEAAAAFGSGDGIRGIQQLAAPLRSKHPEVYGHLIAAGGELLAAYRAAVAASERRWTAPKPSGTEQIDLD
ncbi:DUF5304 domain-containing protein [Streptacidiphilus sp. 4-A2]|nr:DUF5304 domain-containing protein [Streptacidiphilus sp. 4-A2]